MIVIICMEGISELEKIREVAKENWKSVEDKSKKLYELLVTERFTVEGVLGELKTSSYTSSSDMVFGEKSLGGITAVYPKLTLEVTPDKEIPVRFINFDGYSPVKRGDYIEATIPKYEERRFFEVDSILYTERDFKEKENAIELAILSKDGNILRRDRTADYKIFV